MFCGCTSGGVLIIILFYMNFGYHPRHLIGGIMVKFNLVSSRGPEILFHCLARHQRPVINMTKDTMLGASTALSLCGERDAYEEPPFLCLSIYVLYLVYFVHPSPEQTQLKVYLWQPMLNKINQFYFFCFSFCLYTFEK